MKDSRGPVSLGSWVVLFTVATVAVALLAVDHSSTKESISVDSAVSPPPPPPAAPSTLRLTVPGDGEKLRATFAFLPGGGREPQDMTREISTGTTVTFQEASGTDPWIGLVDGTEPTKDPLYRLLLQPSGEPPDGNRKVVDSILVYFTIPVGGSRDLKVGYGPPPEVVIRTLTPGGEPLGGVEVIAAATPRYIFLDGLESEYPEQLGIWSEQDLPEEVFTTDESGRCVLPSFRGWVTTSTFANPEAKYVSDDEPSANFTVWPNPAKVQIIVEHFNGGLTSLTHLGLRATGIPAAGVPWEGAIEKYRQELPVPCSEIEFRADSPIHRVIGGRRLVGLEPGRKYTHILRIQSLRHQEISGTTLPGAELLLREPGGAGRVLQRARAAGGTGKFKFRVPTRGPYDIEVGLGSSHLRSVVRYVRAPRQDLKIPLRLLPPATECRVLARRPGGYLTERASVIAFPHREFHTGGPWPEGMATLLVRDGQGVAAARNVKLLPESAGEVRVELGTGAIVRGRLVDAGGKAVASRWVHLAWPGYERSYRGYRWLADRTAEDGAFEFRKVPLGDYRLFLLPEGFPCGALVTVTPGELDLGDVTRP